MEKIIKNAIEEYQCSGCMNGSGISCFKPSENSVGCSNHYAGTLTSIGKIFLGMPKGFNRLGEIKNLKPTIFKTFEESWKYDLFNIPTWKHVTKDGHTLVRGLSPRINAPFIHIYLEDCSDKINCLEITQKELDEMD